MSSSDLSAASRRRNQSSDQTLGDMPEEELERLKGTFTKLAGREVDNALLHEAADDLKTAGAEI